MGNRSWSDPLGGPEETIEFAQKEASRKAALLVINNDGKLLALVRRVQNVV